MWRRDLRDNCRTAPSAECNGSATFTVGGLAVIYQDVVPTGDARLMGGGG